VLAQPKSSVIPRGAHLGPRGFGGVSVARDLLPLSFASVRKIDRSVLGGPKVQRKVTLLRHWTAVLSVILADLCRSIFRTLRDRGLRSSVTDSPSATIRC
jgi:hypothetical protein